MKNTTKNILAALPLILGLAGPAAAALAEPADSGASNGTAVSIDSLLNQYAGLTPGNSGDTAPATQSASASQKISTFTGSTGPMAAYYTILGVDRTTPNEPFAPAGVIFSSPATGLNSGSGADSLYVSTSAAPSVAALTAVHAVQDSLVGAVSAGSIPVSSSGSISAPVSQASITTPPSPPTPTQLPAAVVLLGSGLAALLPLRKRTRRNIVQMS